MELYEKLKTSFDPFYKAPVELWKQMVEAGDTFYVGKEVVLKSANAIEKYLYFILKGSGGVFLQTEDRLICTDFYFEQDFLGDFMSFLSGKPTPIETITFEKSELFRISKASFSDVMQKNGLSDQMFRYATECLFIRKQSQQISLLTKTAEERYNILLDKYPEVIRRTPQKFIASYLGITPQSLSRIRQKFLSRA